MEEVGKFLLTQGPGGILAAFAIFLWLRTDNKLEKALEKLAALTADSIKAGYEQAAAMEKQTEATKAALTMIKGGQA